MNLRLRLGLTTVAIVAPLALGAIWARRDLPPPPLGIRRGPLPPPRFVPALVVLAVMQLALGPVVGRIRRLTGAVRRSAGASYAKPVAVEGDDEVADLARAFNDAAGEVREQVARQEQRERTLREFLENTTHDIAIPLTVLQGHLAAIRQRVRRGEAVTAEAVGAAMDEAHYLASLTHNLTAAARLESAEPGAGRGPVELGGVVARAVARHPGGRGLGLDIARRAAEAHGWTMALERSEYGGLEVRFAGATGEAPTPDRPSGA